MYAGAFLHICEYENTRQWSSIGACPFFAFTLCALHGR